MPCRSNLIGSPVRHVFIRYCTEHGVGLDSMGHTANFYSLDGPRFETRWGRDFLRTHQELTQPPIKCVRSPFPGSQAAGLRRLPPTGIQRQGEIKSRPIAQPRTELYFYFLRNTTTGLVPVSSCCHQVLLESVRRFES